MSINQSPLQTIFIPLNDKPNWQYWYQLSNGNFIKNDFVTFQKTLQMYVHCKKFCIPFKGLPRSESNSIGTDFALNIPLLVLKRVKSDRTVNEYHNA